MQVWVPRLTFALRQKGTGEQQALLFALRQHAVRVRVEVHLGERERLQHALDLRVQQARILGGHRALDLMIESENAFNRLNATSVVTQQRASDFGRITATRPGRYIQLGSRLTF